MARFDVPATDGTIQGTAGDDVYVINAARVGDVTILDGGGDDTIVLKVPGAAFDMGSLTVGETGLVLDTRESGSVTFASGSGGPASIEALAQVQRPGQPNQEVLVYEVVVSPEPAGVKPALFAGTGGEDVIRMDAPDSAEALQTTSAFGGAGQDLITWDGSGRGHAEGGSDDDRLINRGDGVLDAHGGDGDDVIRSAGTSSGTLMAYGGAGNDTLIGGDVPGSHLDGGAGDDRLRAGAAGAVLQGGEGDDRLTGGAGEDVFLFWYNQSDGGDHVRGFDPASDRISFIGVRADDVEVSHADGSTIITYLDGGRITVAGVTLTEDDLVFAL